ncbi:MAG: hypothetical protein ABII64_02905 [Elusimicrobiota bacterium]
MSNPRTQIPEFNKCTRCGHNWVSRKKARPVICPACKSPYWNRPKGGEALVRDSITEANHDYEDFIGLLNKHGVNYCIVGAYAVGFHAEPRTTGDMDIFVGISEKDAKGVYNALREFGLDDPNLTEDLIKTPGKILRIGLEPNRIEVINSIGGVKPEDVLAHKVKGVYGSNKTFFIGLDELIKNKKAIMNKPMRKTTNDLADYRILTEVKRKKGKL